MVRNMLRIIVAAAALGGAGVAAPPASEVEGLWRYRTIAAGGGEEVAIDGLFLLRDGRFVQQSLSAGEPFDQQLAQAHAGAYRVGDGNLELWAEVGIVVNPKSEQPVESRNDTQHQIQVERSGNELTFTFKTGTVQKFERVGSGEGELFTLEKGAMALANNHFLLVYDGPQGILAGSGAYHREGKDILLRAERWFSVDGGKAEYDRNREEKVTLDEGSLHFENGPTLRFRK